VTQPGRLYGIGVGPGDPELVTLKALRLLRAAPVIAYPAPESGPSFARSIVADWLGGNQREIAIRFPMRPGPAPIAVYDRAADAIATELDAGVDVAVLCQGDPLFYGSFCGLLVRLADRYPIEIVPGVSSLAACAAAAAIPLTMRDETLMVVPATLAEAPLAKRLAAADVAAVVKLGRHLDKVKRVLRRLGTLDNAIYVEHASLPDALVRPLAEVDRAPYFSMALVRAVSGAC
jgi:precorrin-2/cobalt-factor-2 C20-methyltransferase